MNEDSGAPPPFDTRAGWVGALRWGLGAAIERGSRRIVCCDPAFADWPLDDADLLQALVAWLRLPLRRVQLVARGYDDVPRLHPRFTAWRRDWAHAVEAWQPPEERAAALPSLLVADCGVVVQLIDPARWRGRAGIDARAARVWLDEIDAHLQRSERAFAVQSLGL